MSFRPAVLLLAALAACADPVDRSRLPASTDSAWDTVTADTKFSVGGHMDLTGDVLQNLRGRNPAEITREQVRALYDAETAKRTDSALAGRSEDQCRGDLQEMARLAEQSDDRASREFFRGLVSDVKLRWREKLRKAVTFACDAARPRAEEIVLEVVAKVGAFQKRHAWKNAEAVDLVLNCNLATDLHQFEGKCYMFVFYILYPSGSGQISDVKRLIGDMPEGVKFNTSGTNGFHFDDLFHYDEIEKRWEDLRAWSRHQVARAQARWSEGGRDDFLRVVGISSHSVQDFYCHSNWVSILRSFVSSDDPEDYPVWKDVASEPPSAFRGVVLAPAITGILRKGATAPTWDRSAILDRMKESNRSISDDPTRGGLQTGGWDRSEDRDPLSGLSVRGWQHRHPEEPPESLIAPVLAARATGLWIDELMDQLDEAKRKDLIEYISAPR